MALNPRDLVPLQNAIDRLTTIISSLTGNTAPGGGGVFESAVGTKSQHKLQEEMVERMGELIDATKKSTATTEKHIKAFELLGATMAIVTPVMQQLSKYNFVRPYEMLGGQMGVIGGRQMERERDFGNLVFGAAAFLGTILGGPLVGGAIGGLGLAGGNQMLGRLVGSSAARRAAAEETVGRMFGEQVPGFMDATKQQYGLMKLDVAGLGGGLGAGRGTAMAASLTAIGMSAPESIALISKSIEVGGMQGFRRLEQAGGAEAIKSIVNKGIYGTDPTQIAAALASGLRIGFTREMLEGGSRRTGLQLAEMAQAATMARAQTYLAGAGAGNMLFTMASNTQMARDLGMPAAMANITQAAGGASAAAEGDEASSMLLFRQFLQANPGATYLDFVEARRNKETDIRWLRMVGRAAGTFTGMGQTGKILGGQLLGTKPMMVEGLAGFMGEALAPGGIGEMMGARGEAGLAKGAQLATRATFDQTMKQATTYQAQYGTLMEETAAKVKIATERVSDFNTYMDEMADIMNSLSRSIPGVWAGTMSENAAKRHEGTQRRGYPLGKYMRE